MNDVDLMHCIERTRRSERRPDMLHILDEMAKRLVHKSPDMSANGRNVTEPLKLIGTVPVEPKKSVTPCPVCEKARKRNIARQKRYREKGHRHNGSDIPAHER